MIHNGVLIIVFSYNRALQLDCLLRTIKERFKIRKYHVVIIYHVTGKHRAGYDALKEKYKRSLEISFIERNSKSVFSLETLPLLFKNRNLWRYIKYPFLRKPHDNFKRLLESQISSSDYEFTMFLTDDGYFFKEVEITDSIFELIRKNPYQISYRLYVGENLQDCPLSLEKIDGTLRWDYADSNMYNHWAYPFSVDATIYHSNTLLKVLKPILYHMPTTLESFVVTHCRLNKLFRSGISPVESSYVGLFINRVSTIGNNFSGNINVDFLNEKFLEGYVLEYGFALPPVKSAFIPDKIMLINTSKNIIYLK